MARVAKGICGYPGVMLAYISAYRGTDTGNGSYVINFRAQGSITLKHPLSRPGNYLVELLDGGQFGCRFDAPILEARRMGVGSYMTHQPLSETTVLKSLIARRIACFSDSIIRLTLRPTTN
jgi:hypothetical protein